MLKNKAMTTMIALILMLSIAIPLSALPVANAAVYNKKTYAYIGATPNPIGVGQEVLIHVGISDALNNVAHGFEGLTVTVTKPDNTTETLGPFRTDSTGGTGTVMVPSMVGTYTLQTHFPEQWYNWTAGGGADVLYQASSSIKLSLVVNEESVPYYQDLPLPTEYWTRPINAQLRGWSALAGSSWMSSEYNEGIESPHILWAKPIGQAGGIMGGEHGEFSFDCGDAYVGKFSNRHTIAGLLIYNKFEARIPTEQQEMVAVDIRTGEELWSRPLIGVTGTTTGDTVPAAQRLPEGVTERFPDGTPRLVSMSQTYMWDSFNLHGGYAFIWTVTGSTWMAFDPFTGGWRYTITNVPSGTTVRGENGELLRYEINYGRQASQASGWVALWNSTKIVTWQTGDAMAAGSWNPHGNVFNASGLTSAGNPTSRHAAAWEWNVTIPKGLPGSGTFYHDDMIHGYDRGGTTIVYNTLALGDPPFYVWAVSLKPNSRGQLMYNNTYRDLIGGNMSLSISRGIEDRVFVMWSKEARQMWGYDIDTGAKLWGPTQEQHYLDIFGAGRSFRYGNIYSRGYGGELYAYNARTGQHLWTYEAFDPYNEILWGVNWPTYIADIFDEKIYLIHYEHSPVDPKSRGAPFICLDANTGEELWRVDGLLRGSSWGGNPIVGDSVMMLLNSYDQRIYAIGKGPSATSVSAPDVASSFGTHVLIKGTVTDISPGTTSDSLALRFPNGVPAVADESMGDWMLYVYTQFPRPVDAVGVDVTLDVVDANGNYRNIGTAITDANGNFNFAWRPDISGLYKVIATFAGSKSYYASFAETAFMVEEVAEATAVPTEPPASVADLYFVPAIAGLFVAILVVGALMMLMLRKRP